MSVNSREGNQQVVTLGNSTTTGRKTFLALNGNSYYISFIPGETHKAENYTTLYKSGTLTFNSTVSGAIPVSYDYSVTIPVDAQFFMGIKFTHFTDFSAVDPKSIDINGDTKTYNYFLAAGQQYNYRTWMEGGLTQAGIFTMNADETKRPSLSFSEEDYKQLDPHKINHDPTSNDGLETGDIFLNINPEGHLKLNIGDTFDAHAMRTWEITSTTSGNYFIEPDFHYTILDLNGNPSSNVIEISSNQDNPSPWAKIKAIGSGSAIVLVTYDAINVNAHTLANKTPFTGGENWGAIWPENTGVYIVTVGDNASGINPNMIINEKYNLESTKLSGKYVDAEHDVFYYLDTEDGARYTFTPEGVDNVTIAYPTIGERMANYTGFSSEGVTKNADGSYTLLLKEGRQIVKLTNMAGKSEYQVLTAKSCHREISNETRKGSNIFLPGDKVKIQYSGLFHGANKLAGIYNMSAYVTYNGIPNGSSLILGSGQYTFASKPEAQAVSLEIPANFDTENDSTISLTEGVIQINGFGDPIGSHRDIDPRSGRSPNFTAIGHKTYLGAIPDVKIQVAPLKYFNLKLTCNVTDAIISIVSNEHGDTIQPDSQGEYIVNSGIYSITAQKYGYRYYHNEFEIDYDADPSQTFAINMIEADDATWDGTTLLEPAIADGSYQISCGDELAWFMDYINSYGRNQSAILTEDIDLGDFPWTPGLLNFNGCFDGNGFAIKGLYLDTQEDYVGLFDYSNGTIKNLTVYGSVKGGRCVGAIVGQAGQQSVTDRCVNYASVSGVSSVGGIIGYLEARQNSISTVTNCYNLADISGDTACGGIIGSNDIYAVMENLFSLGEVSGQNAGSCIGGPFKKTNSKNVFGIEEYDITEGQTLVTEEQMRSGEVAYLLGEAFGQEIGVDEHPVIGGMKVLYDETSGRYYNEDGGTSGIDDVSVEDCGDTIYYNLEGVASDRPFKGFNIVRNGNVTTKIFIR